MSIRLLATVMLLALTGATQAELIVGANAALAAGTFYEGSGPLMATVNGAGLGAGYPQFPDTHVGANADGFLGNGTNASLHYDFGAQRVIERVRIWNYHGSWSGGSVPQRGVKDVVLYGSNDPAAFSNDTHASWTQFASFQVAQATSQIGGLIPYGEQFDFAAVSYRLVKFRINSNWDASPAVVGLAEVQFIGPLNPSVYRGKMKISFENYARAEVLTNFPVLVRLRDRNKGFRYSQMGAPSTGGDLRLADTNNMTLHAEIESWGGATNGDSYVWVRIPVLTSNTWIWAYWGNTNATVWASGYVWNSDYRGVWHLADTNGTFKDATANHSDSTAASVGTGKEGVANGGQQFRGSPDYIRTPLTSKYQTFTLSALVKPETTAGDIQALISQVSFWAVSVNDMPAMLNLSADGTRASVLIDSGDPDWTPDRSVKLGGVQTGAWNYVAGMYDGTTLTVFVNGQAATTNGTVTLSSNSRNWTLGRAANEYDGGANKTGLKGYLDEARIANVAQGTNWLWASYMNLLQHDTFVHYWPAEVSGSSGTLIMIR